MILKGSQRSNGAQLASHLLNDRDNDHVTVHEVSGTISENVTDAFQEMYAISRGTRCSQYLFSLSLSPPIEANVSTRDFEDAVNRCEDVLNLKGQPRTIIFHEKDGRRHAHAVWSRIDGQSMKAIPMTFFKQKLTSLSRELYVEHDWAMPEGLIDRSRRNPLNYTLVEWQQAKRHKQSPTTIKTQLKGCWATSSDRESFEKALERKGYYLAKGNRRSYVALDWQGEVYSLSRWLNVKKHDLKQRLGESTALESVDTVKQTLSTRLNANIREQLNTLLAPYAIKQEQLTQRIEALNEQHQQQRQQLKTQQTEQWQQLKQRYTSQHQSRVRQLWQWLTGQQRKQDERYRHDAQDLLQQHSNAREALVHRQLQARREIQHHVNQLMHDRETEVEQFKTQLFEQLNNEQQMRVQDTFDKVNQRMQQRQGRTLEQGL